MYHVATRKPYGMCIIYGCKQSVRRGRYNTAIEIAMSHKRKSALETLNNPQAKCPRVEYQVPSETEQWIDGKTSGKTKRKTDKCTFTCDCEHVLAQKIASHRKEIAQHTNIGKLRSYLNQEKLLNPEENQYLQSDALNTQKVYRVLDSLKEKPNGFTRFLACVKGERSHLGHVYITSLLEGTQFASEPELRLSALCKQRIDENLPRLIRGINLSSLMPHLKQSFYLPCCGVQAQLLTNDDVKKLWNVKGTNKRIRQLFLILETKGPLAHYQFAACMQAENEHTTHHELFRDIFGNLNFLELMDGVVLEGSCYDKLMEKFYFLHHNSDGHQQLVTEAEEAMAQDLPLELQALYRIELARSFIFRTQNERAEELLSAALKICGKISEKNANLVPEARNKNAFIIYGRCHYTLADLFRFTKDYARAKEHSGKALDALDDVKPGLDTANAHYVNGCILLERHIAKPSIPLDIQVIERFFNSAISDGEDSDVARRVTTPQSYCRLAQLYMCSGVTGNEDNLKKARQSLDACKRCDLDIISQRTRYLYFVVESEWYTINGDTEKADDAALKAHQIAEKTSDTLEILTLKTVGLYN